MRLVRYPETDEEPTRLTSVHYRAASSRTQVNHSVDREARPVSDQERCGNSRAFEKFTHSGSRLTSQRIQTADSRASETHTQSRLSSQRILTIIIS